MAQKFTFGVISSLFFFLNGFAQDYYPGGISGAEAWYIIDYYDLDNQIHTNHSLKEIKIDACNYPLGEKSLFNFNHSVAAQNLCLFYNSPLENTTSRNVFFVGQQIDHNYNYSHLMTKWAGNLGNLFPNDTVRNRFDLSTNDAYFNKQLSSYTGINNANINFYHWNMYQTDRKFKSYGIKGETVFNIGQGFINPLSQAESYSGNFPEFISFPFELTANQKNRVESYLALKYGITLESSKSYRNSKNVIFWTSRNNSRFGNRIFGIGRDNISGLNQLQSHSEHLPGYLVAAVEGIEETNHTKQEIVTIDDNHFIVFGDNGGATTLQAPNAVNVQILSRKWLSQNTGSNSKNFPMNFKLRLEGDMPSLLNEGNKLWMLHDKFVTNQQVSSFTSQYVEYYEADHLDGLDYGYFKDVFFDPDNNVYDQYTFGIGPEMIVQARFNADCNPYTAAGNVVVTGGRAPYNITITNTQGYYFNTISNERETAFSVPTSYTYTIEVTDSLNNYATVEINIPVSQIELDLGPDQILSASQQQVVLDANSYGLNDADATYKWFNNGEVIEHYETTLTVSQPGEYTVEVANANRTCIKTDSIVISYNFTGTVEQILDCNAPGTISLKLQGGVPPYSTVISGGGQTIYEVHATDDTIFTDINYGIKTITTTDSNEQVFQTTINVLDLGAIPLNIAGQMPQICYQYYSDPQSCSYGIEYPFFVCETSIDGAILDASVLVSNPNVSYEWYMEGQLAHVGPIVELYQDYAEFGHLCGGPEITVVATNLNSGCITSETILIAKNYGVKNVNSSSALRTDTNAESVTEQDKDKQGIETKVYPNPSASGATFYYEVTSNDIFGGTIEIFSPTGALLRQEFINGQSSYTIPFELTTSGVYLICTKTNGTILTDKIIIK